MPQKKDRIITVDGVGYSLDTGKSVGASSKPAAPVKASDEPVKSANTLDLRHFSLEPSDSSIDSAAPKINDAKSLAKPRLDIAGSGKQVKKEPLEPSTVRTPKTDEKIEEDSQLRQSAEPVASSAKESHRKVHSGYFKKVMVLPFTERVDRYVVQAILLSTMISPYFWLLALSPGLAVRLLNTQKYTLTDLLGRVRAGLAPGNYYTLAVMVGIFLALSLVSLLISCLVRMVARATKLRMIDRRSVSQKLLYRQAANKSLRSLCNWLLNAITVGLVALGSTCLVWWLIASRESIISSSLPAILPLTGIVLAVVMVLLAMHWPLSQTMIAATDKSVWFVQWHSFKLTFGSAAKNLLSAVMLGLVSLVAGALLGLIGWAEVTYLVSSSYLYMQIGLFVLGAILMLTVLVAYRIWWNMFLASHYHVLASSRGKVAMSNYLSLEKPAKTSLTPFIVTTVMAVIILAGYWVAAYSYQDVATAAMKKVYNRIPASLEIKIPKPTK